MSIKNIIQESLNKNPIGLKEALTEELRSRVAAVLESMISEKKKDDDCDDKAYDADSEGEYDDKKTKNEEVELDEASNKAFKSKDKTSSAIGDHHFDMYADHQEMAKKHREIGGRQHEAAAKQHDKAAKAHFDASDEHQNLAGAFNSGIRKSLENQKADRKRAKEASHTAALHSKTAYNTSKSLDIHEEVEQIDEISKSTLGSYLTKSTSQAIAGGHKLGKDMNMDDVHHLVKRAKGINTAINKLTKEESEQIDEISTPKLAHYMKKASTDLANASANKEFMRANLPDLTDKDERTKEKVAKTFDKHIKKRKEGIATAASKISYRHHRED